MANPVRYTFQYHFSYVPNLTCLYLKAAIGALGAPTINANASMGVTSITRSSAGKYVVTFNKSYAALRMVNARFIALGGINAPDVTVDTDNVANGTMTIVCQVGGINTDPSSGSSLLLEIMLKDSTVAIG